MSCCSSPGGCGGDKPFPWFSALRDPAILRLFLARYRREWMAGLAAGAVAGAALSLIEPLGALGPAMGAPWLHLHPAAVVPATLLAGPALFLRLANDGRRAWAEGAAWALAFLVLGGLANILLEAAEPIRVATFFQDGGYAYPLAFTFLGLPALWLAWEAAAWMGLQSGKGCS
jgi:hypothetical protein